MGEHFNTLTFVDCLPAGVIELCSGLFSCCRTALVSRDLAQARFNRRWPHSSRDLYHFLQPKAQARPL